MRLARTKSFVLDACTVLQIFSNQNKNDIDTYDREAENGTEIVSMEPFSRSSEHDAETDPRLETLVSRRQVWPTLNAAHLADSRTGQISSIPLLAV